MTQKNTANMLAKECIVHALLKLVKVKPVSSITISELCRLAGVSRMTFYRNYDSKEEIFSVSLIEILETYEQEEINIFQGKGNYFDLERLEHGFQYFNQHKEFLNGMFRCGFSNIFLEKLTDYILYKWEDPELDNRYELFSFAGALYNVYIGWALDNYTKSMEELAQIINGIYRKELSKE